MMRVALKVAAALVAVTVPLAQALDLNVTDPSKAFILRSSCRY
jgi:hypothetical protein